MPVRVAYLYADLGAYIRVAKGIGAAGASGDIGAVAQPLVTEGAQAVRIADTRGIGAERLILGHGAADRRQARRRVVDIGHRSSLSRGQALNGAVPVRVAHSYPDLGAHVGIAQGVSRAGGTTDRHPVAQPLVAEDA